MRHIIFAFTALIVLTACGGRSPETINLSRATELVVSPGTEKEARLSGEKLARYLETFEPTDPPNPFNMILHTTSEPGVLTIGKHSYPVRIGSVKVADVRESLTFTDHEQQLRFMQRADSKPRLLSKGADSSQ